MKKAQGNTFWIIITAVIALIVLIILLLIFTGKTTILEAGLLSCESKGGDCTTSTGNPCPSGFLESSAFSCKDTTKICCLGIKNTTG
ncbi:MAG: hypothetical protein ABIA37_00115 [Candidatus Woesearchaeota archaeon]